MADEEVWTYEAANTIRITGDLTAKYRPNKLIMITQGSDKFFVIMASELSGADTLITVSGGGVYTLTSAAITAHSVTTNSAPEGVPIGFAGQAVAYGAATKDTPANDDKISLWDSAASFIQKSLTWANLKAALETVFDSRYAATAKGVTNGDSHDHAGGDGAQIDHGGQSGLTDDDHTGYALLAGRSGGQTIEGDTASGGNLTLSSTHHATKGKIVMGTSAYDEVNNRLGLAKLSPSYPLHLASGAQIYFDDLGEIRCFDENHRIYFDRQNNKLDLIEYGSIYISSNAINGVRTNNAYFSGNGNLWLANNCSALSFTDRTNAYMGDALAAIKRIAADQKGNIDHATLPEFAINPYQDEKGEWWAGRDIGNMISILTKGVQELVIEIGKRDKEIANLSARLDKLEKK